MIRKSIVGFVFFVLPALALSATEGTLSVSPAVVMLQGNVGQSTTQTMTIMNVTSEPMSFDMTAKDVVMRDGKRTLVNAGELAGSVANTAIFSPKNLTVAPGEKRTVEVTVTIPNNPAARAIIAMFQGTTKLQRKGMQITASLGTLLTFALSDNASAETSALSVAQKLSNESSEPVLAQGMLAIVSPAGTLVAKQAMTPRRLLPGETTGVKAEYGGELSAGRYRALVTYVLQNNKTLTSSAEFDVR